MTDMIISSPEGPQNSLVKLARKTLKLKGTSEHNGRGAYWMTVNADQVYDWEAVKQRFVKLAARLQEQGHLVSSKVDKDELGEYFHMVGSDVYFNECYRTLTVRSKPNDWGHVASVDFSLSKAVEKLFAQAK